MTDNSTGRSLYEAYGEGGFEWAKVTLDEEGYLGPEILALVVETNSGRPLPDWFRDYLGRHLRGQVKMKPGPRRNPSSDVALEMLFVRTLYRQALRVFQYLIMRQRRAAQRRGETLPRAELAAHEMALDWLQMRGICPDLDRRSLHNRLTGNKGGGPSRSPGSKP